jgi:predicted ATPase
LVENSDAIHSAGVTRGLLDQTNAWLGEIAPGTELEVADIAGTDFVRLAFHQQGADIRSGPQRATNVGFGLTHALPIIVACLTASRGDLLLIENPESHLHPSAQAAVGRLCGLATRSGAQVIVETHSDHVLNAIRLIVKDGALEEDDVLIHFFTRPNRALQPTYETTRIGPDGMIGYWPRGFFDEWDRAVDALLE